MYLDLKAYKLKNLLVTFLDISDVDRVTFTIFKKTTTHWVHILGMLHESMTKAEEN